MITIDEVIDVLLSADKPLTVSFPGGAETTLRPQRFTLPTDEPKLRISLNGEWRATRYPFVASEVELVATGVNDAAWEKLEQPGRVFYADPEEDTANIPNWDRRMMTHIKLEDGAVLRRTVEIPAEWGGQRIYLHFGAIYPGGRIYINGILLGEHLSGLTPAEYDVTDLVTPGECAVVAVRLLRRHEQYMEMDMPRHSLDFAGISQDIKLFAVPGAHVASHHLIAALNDDFTVGTISGSVQLRNNGTCACAGKLTLTLIGHGQTVSSSVPVTLPQNAEVAAEISVLLANPALWNDEYPNLYEVTLQLELDCLAPQTISYRTGFGKLELSGGRPRFNGNPVKFRGVNHLSFHPQLGIYTPKEWLRQSLELMKKANVNCIRTHYTAPPALAELCDEMGIYLLQELPIDWFTHGIPNPSILGIIMLRLEAGVRRDRHHVCLQAWTIGNENLAEDSETHDAFWAHTRLFHKLVKTLDPIHATVMPPPGPANRIKGLLEVRVGDIADTHYNFNYVREFNDTGSVTLPESWQGPYDTKLTREEAVARGWSGVWMSSEYMLMNYPPDLLNAPYLSIIGDVLEDPLCGKNSQQVFIDRLSREWGYMRDDPTCIGGAFFPWMCSGSGDSLGLDALGRGRRLGRGDA
ncbi:MAG: glycoside hydrolase family 2 TIM barrel-domain containing protein [bacterium]